MGTHSNNKALNTPFSKEDTQIVKHKKTGLTLLVIREMQIEIKMRYYFIAIEMTSKSNRC